MTETLLHRIGESYPLSERPTGAFAALKVEGMRFSIRAYHAEGLGHVSVMRAKGFFGRMTMDTLMVVPTTKDLPLYSYDRIRVMGNDTLIVELYDTLIGSPDLSSLDAIKASASHLPERDPGAHWYDAIKLPQSLSKKGKRLHTPALDALADEYFRAYLKAPAANTSDENKKKALSARYVDGLLSHGGPSTDVFKKALGEDKTATLFRTVLFGVDLPSDQES